MSPGEVNVPGKADCPSTYVDVEAAALTARGEAVRQWIAVRI